MLGGPHPTLGRVISLHPNRLWRRWVAILAAASSFVAAVAAWSSALRLEVVGEHGRAWPFAVQGAVATGVAAAVVLVVALRSLERVVVHERGLVHRGVRRSREVRFVEIRDVELQVDALGEHVRLDLQDGRELRLGSVGDGARLAALVRSGISR